VEPTTKKVHKYLSMPVCLILLLLLIGFQSIPLMQGSTSQAISEAALQRVRTTAIVKNTLILKYSIDGQTRAQAISDLQASMPLFEKEQGVIAGYPPGDIQLLVAASRSDYLSIDTALGKITSHPNDAITDDELNLILNHTTTYNMTMGQIVIAMQTHIDNEARVLFLCELVIDAILIAIALILFFSIKCNAQGVHKQ